MSYRDCASGTCTRLPQWSNPDVSVFGSPSGDAAERDNARALDERGAEVAAFRTDPIPLPQADIDLLPLSVALFADSSRTLGFDLANAAPAGAQPLLVRLSLQSGAGTWTDSSMPDGPAFSWTDIALSGDRLYLGDDDYSQRIALPFSFPFFGAEHDGLYVGSNGLLTFDAGTTSNQNQPLPSPDAPNHLIAMLWDDLDPFAGGTVHQQDMGDGRFIVQFTDVPRYGETEGQSFQAVLYEDGTVELFYLHTDGSPSYSIGAENADGTLGVGVAYDQPYLTDEFAVRIEQAGPPWLRIAQPGQSLAPGASASVPLLFDAAGLPEGTYTETIKLVTNDPALALAEIPVTLTVSLPVTLSADASQATFGLSAPFPNPSQGSTRLPFTLAEAGPVRLDVVDALGRNVATLAAGELAAGAHTRTLDTSALVPGLYVVRLEAGAQVEVQRLTVLR